MLFCLAILLGAISFMYITTHKHKHPRCTKRNGDSLIYDILFCHSFS